MSIVKICKTLSLLILFSLVLFSEDKIDKTKVEIDKTKKLLKEKISQKQLYEKRQKAISQELKNIESEIKKIESEKQKLKNKIHQVKNEIYLLEKKIKILTSDIEFFSRVLEIGVKNYVNRYILREQFYDNMLIHYMLKTSLQHQVQQLVDTKKSYEYTQQMKEKYNQSKVKLEKMTQQLVEKENVQKTLFAKKSVLLEETKQSKRKVEQEIVQLKQTQRELENLLKKLVSEKKKVEKEKLQEVKIDRKFPKPIVGEIVHNFGKEIKDGIYTVRNGVVIQGLSFAEVYAVDDGKVVFISEKFRSYGKMVIIEHKDEIYSVYANLGKIEVLELQEVKKFQPIGKTDSTGQVYFELRKSVTPVDPKLYFE